MSSFLKWFMCKCNGHRALLSLVEANPDQNGADVILGALQNRGAYAHLRACPVHPAP